MGTSDREEAVLTALREAAPASVSGEALAAELGVSRVAVGKRVNALREHGYAIEAVPGLGYRLLSAPDLPLPAEVRPLLTAKLWTRLTGGGTTGSTNDDAKELARNGAPEGSVVLAAEQLHGRGRLGRRWSSPGGGVYLSAVLRPPLALADASALPLVAGIGVARGFAALGLDARLKWPNDVYCGDGRKLAGVLVETTAEDEQLTWVVVGVGTNVHRPDEGIAGACYLEEIGRPFTLAEVAARVLDGLAGAYADFLDVGFAGMRREYEERAWLTGREITVRDTAGAVRAAGRVAGVDESGRLVIEGADGRSAVAAGEVTLKQGS